MADDFQKLGTFSEQGRGLPVELSRPAPALPFTAIGRHAYAPSPRVRLGWAQGVLLVGDAQLELPHAVTPGAPLGAVARCMSVDDSDYVPVIGDDRFLGVVFIDDLLRCVADGLNPPDMQALISSQIPTCSPRSELVDAVRQMVACWLRRIPVVGDDGALIGMLTLAAAMHAGERDPSVRDVLENATRHTAFFARRWR
ncbi:MAG TPA: CBS domain-containing protein [Kofleriaceae bacterium]|nr:CBS domain-containing protein [Kofleriaceae bacterium]